MKLRALVFMALLAAASCAAFAQQASAAGPQAALKAQLQRVRDLRQQRPDDAMLVYYEALTHVALGQRKEAVAELRTLLGKRAGVVPTRHIGFDAVWDDPDFQSVVRQLSDEEPRTPLAPVVFRLPDARLIPEGIAYDPKRRVHLLGSIAQRKILAVDERGRVHEFSSASDSLDAVLGLAVDAQRDRLCAVSTNGFEESAQKERRNAVLCWGLADGKLQARLNAPDALQLNDLAIAPDGTWYVTDSQAGALYRVKPGSAMREKLGDPAALRGANGVALAPDGTVYVAISTGITRVDPATGAAARMPQPEHLVVGGIDGLYWHAGALVGVQNVSNPGRVIRIELAEQGRRIGGVQVLQSHHHPEFAEPTTGVLVGTRLHVIANSHIGHHRPDNSLRDPARLRGTAIVAVPLQRP